MTPGPEQTGDRRVERRKVLANVSIFSDLDDEALDRLLEVTSTRRLKPKEVLIHKGEPGNQLYGVIEGRLKVHAAGKDGKEVVFGFSDPGEVIGEIALLDQNPRSATITAVEPSELLTLDRRDFLPFLARYPKVAIHLAELLAGRVRRLTETTEDAMLLTLPTRLAKKLLALAQSYGKQTPEGTLIDLRLQQQELGDMVGTSRESINKQLRSWAAQGLVAVERSRVTVVDTAGLEAIAHFTFD
ncbi:MAG: Crp/Fnr family transcriptional regulator [Proteobacteria bacterium]|nr:Crp/Fnr family transcriptional regulator [Pseudomonadota bacterium]